MGVDVVAIEVTALRRRLRQTVQTARGAWSTRNGWLVRLSDSAGRVGFGEVSPLPAAGTETGSQARTALRALRAAMLAVPASPCDPPALPAGLGPSARFGVETALLDLAAQRAGLPLYRWLGGSGDEARVEVNALLMARDRARDADRDRSRSRSRSRNQDGAARIREARRACEAGFGCLKLKLADAGPEALSAVRDLRAAVGPAPRLRVDWNGALDRESAQRILGDLRDVDLEYAEQPVPAGSLSELRALRGSGVAIAADEAASDVAGVRRVLAEQAADVVVLKPATLGGLLQTLALAREAAAVGVGVVVTSLLDGAVAHLAALHLVAALPGPRRAAGLATASALTGDPFPAPVIERGGVRLGAAPGLGLAR